MACGSYREGSAMHRPGPRPVRSCAGIAAVPCGPSGEFSRSYPSTLLIAMICSTIAVAFFLSPPTSPRSAIVELHQGRHRAGVLRIEGQHGLGLALESLGQAQLFEDAGSGRLLADDLRQLPPILGVARIERHGFLRRRQRAVHVAISHAYARRQPLRLGVIRVGRDARSRSAPSAASQCPWSARSAAGDAASGSIPKDPDTCRDRHGAQTSDA